LFKTAYHYTFTHLPRIWVPCNLGNKRPLAWELALIVGSVPVFHLSCRKIFKDILHIKTLIFIPSAEKW